MTTSVVIVYCVALLFTAVRSQISSDPAPGRSPGPPSLRPFIVTDDEIKQPVNTVKSDIYESSNVNEFRNDLTSDQNSDKQKGLTDIKYVKSGEKPTVPVKSDLNKPVTMNSNKSDMFVGCQTIDQYKNLGNKVIVHESVALEKDIKIPFSVDVTHHIFNTENGMINGLIYTVTVTEHTGFNVTDFIIESMVNEKPGGSFIITHHSHRHSDEYVKRRDGKYKTHESMYSNQKVKLNGNGLMKPETSVESIEITNHPYDSLTTRLVATDDSGSEIQRTDNKIKSTISGNGANDQFVLKEHNTNMNNHQQQPHIGCPENVWYNNLSNNRDIDDSHRINVRKSKWILNDPVEKDSIIDFRVLYRLMNSSTINEFKYSYQLQRECVLRLKSTSGHLDHLSLPIYHSNCTVYFPSYKIPSFETKPSGLLVKLQRFNIPCTTGGYLEFIDGTSNQVKHKLCGKLEELQLNERTFHLELNNRTSIQVQNHPIFYLNYEIVEFCYNLTISNQSASYYLKPMNSMQCQFRIHLPYGNKINLSLWMNHMNMSSYGHLNQQLIDDVDDEFLDLSVQQSDSKISDIKFNCNGLLIEISDDKHRWQYCNKVFGVFRKFTLISSSNILIITITRIELNESIDDDDTTGALINLNQTVISSMDGVQVNDFKYPSLYFEYHSKGIPDIVSQCAFGWIQMDQFCVSPVERMLTWDQAESECVRLNGHLAIIRSDSDQKIIDSLIKNSPGYKDEIAYWIGATDRLFEGDFRWSNGITFGYTNWFPGWPQHAQYNKQPNDDGLSNQDCLEIRRHFHVPPGLSSTQTIPQTSTMTTSYMWNDRDCGAKNYFLCERSIVDESVGDLWKADCNKTIMLNKESPRASLASPGFPKQYPDNANCFTIITAPIGYHIILEFEELVIESEQECSYDYLDIFESSVNGYNGQDELKWNKQLRHDNRQYSPKENYKTSPETKDKHEPQQHLSFIDDIKYIEEKLDIVGLNNRDSERRIDGDTVYRRFIGIFKPSVTKFVVETPVTASLNSRRYSSPSPTSLKYNGKGNNGGGSSSTIQPATSRRLCGDWSSKLKLLRHVTKDSMMGLNFVSDYSHHFSGYKARVTMENAISDCGDDRLKPFNGSCYLLVSYPEVDWWTAQQICRGIGAQLASVSTSNEQRFITTNIRNLFDYSPQAVYWLGGEQLQDGDFEWSDGSKMTYQGWLPGQRMMDGEDVPKEQICLGLSRKISQTPSVPSGLYWTAKRCSKIGGYVCKKKKYAIGESLIQNQTVTGFEGRLTSPGYPNTYPLNTDYWVRITGPERTRIIVQFQKIDLEHQDECLYDYVSVQNAGHETEKFTEPGLNIVPMAMLINTDLLNRQWNGDDLKLGSRPLKLRKRNILEDKASSSSSRQYQRYSRVKRYSKSAKQRTEFGENHFNSHNRQLNNYPTFEPYVRWCGSFDSNMSQFDFISSTNQALLHFHSDYAISENGFSAIWSAVDVSGCPRQTITSREGKIISPNYPYFLLNNLDCTFTIQAPIGKRVWIEITDFDLIEDSIVSMDVGNGPFTPFANKQQINDGVFVSSMEKLHIRLRTGNRPKGRGFIALFKTIYPVVEQTVVNLVNTSNGVLLHLNHPQEMPISVDFTQRLIAPLGDIILLELYGVSFHDNDCINGSRIEIHDNYADYNGTTWYLCNTVVPIPKGPFHTQISKSNSERLGIDINHYPNLSSPSVQITSYLNSLYIKQRTTLIDSTVKLNASVRTQPDPNYRYKLAVGNDYVESCTPNLCQNEGKCITADDHKRCQCKGHFTGKFCSLTVCELEPCHFGQCELTTNGFKCHCQKGYVGDLCDQRQKPCADNPCEGRGECFEKNDGFFCRCHAWWEGAKCERRMVTIPYKPLSERMLQEPFWLGLITVFVVLGVIGLVWCAKRHFPEKIEKLLAEEADRNRPPGMLHGQHHQYPSLREQLQFTNTSAPQSTATTPGAPRSIFGRLGIRKPSILSLSSPQPATSSATARTFSLDDLLRPPPRRSPSPRKKRNNSTPTKKNAAEKKQILQQLISPSVTRTRQRQVSLGELVSMSENHLKPSSLDSEPDMRETTFTENSCPPAGCIPRNITDPKLEKKVTFARLLNKVSAEMSSGSEADFGTVALSLPVDVAPRANSVPPSPCTNDMRSPHSTSSNQGSDSLSSSELLLTDVGLMFHLNNLKNRRPRPKVSSADSILAMFRNFTSTSVSSTMPASLVVSPSTTPPISTPQDDLVGDDESSTSSMPTPMSYTSQTDSPLFYRSNTMEVPVLDPLNGHKNIPSTNLLCPPTVLLEIPNNINKCLSPIREMPTPMPSPALTPVMPRPQRSRSPSPLEDPFSASYSDDDCFSEHSVQLIVDLANELNKVESDRDMTPPEMNSSTGDTQTNNTNSAYTLKFRQYQKPPPIQISIDVEPPTPEQRTPVRPRDLIIPELVIQQPSPTKEPTFVVMFPGSPPPQRERASLVESNGIFPNKQQQKRLLKEFDKPTSLDLPFILPTITITTNASEGESDIDTTSSMTGKPGGSGLCVPNSGMSYLSPFSMCTQGDRTISESNLSSSGYSSMASPGPSRCGSSNPLFPNDMEHPGSGPSGSHYTINSTIPVRRQILKNSQSNKKNESGASGGGQCSNADCARIHSESETLSDDTLLESNDEGIGTDHLDEKIEDGEIKSAKDLEIFIGKEFIDSGKNLMGSEDVPAMSSLQLPTILVQQDGGELGVSPVSSRSESPMSERTSGLLKFSPHFYGNTEQQLPFTDSDGLYDFPSSDGKGNCNHVHRKLSCKRKERKFSRSGHSPSPTKTVTLLEIPCKDLTGNQPKHYHSVSARKSPKRRPPPRQQISSSSSSESLHYANTRLPKMRLSSTKIIDHGQNPTNINRMQMKSSSAEEELKHEIMSNTIINHPLAKPSGKLTRLRAIGNQIRFLRRLEKSIKRREYLLSPTDSEPENRIEDENESSKVTAPLLYSTRDPIPTKLSYNQCKIVGPRRLGRANLRYWRGGERTYFSGEINSD